MVASHAGEAELLVLLIEAHVRRAIKPNSTQEATEAAMNDGRDKTTQKNSAVLTIPNPTESHQDKTTRKKLHPYTQAHTNTRVIRTVFSVEPLSSQTRQEVTGVL